MSVKAGRLTFFWAVFTDKARRPELLQLAWKDVGKVFIVAFTLGVIYELIVWHWVYPTQAILVAVVLAFIPYLLVRGPVTRIARRFH
jgi:Flp pilus assembly protein TadB